MSIKNLRNIAIIAHVNHGKTTLIDKLLQQSDLFNKNNILEERIMDSHELEKERGITIVAKNIAIKWNNYHINIIDTPGHADFGGEVERVMSMVDNVLLLVDAIEGPMPQTRFVTQKAFNYGFKPIVVINKIDRPGIRPNWVIDKIFDLFVNLEATDEQLDFPIIYVSALKGMAGKNYDYMEKNMIPLYEAIVKYVSPPEVKLNSPFQMQISQLDYDNYLGIIGIGRINRGTIKPNVNVTIIDENQNIRNAKINKIFTYLGLERIESTIGQAGNIIALTGLGKLHIFDTICDINKIERLPKLLIDEPTISVCFGVNTSPLCGREGKYITSNKIYQRLKNELMNNISLKLEKIQNSDNFCVSGRGELHLSILIENMRREGFELEISKPQVIIRKKNGNNQEPFEYLTLNIEKQYLGNVMQTLNKRKAELHCMSPDGKDRIKLDYIITSRGLIGFRIEFMIITLGSGVLHAVFSHYDDIKYHDIGTRQQGVMISNGKGKAVAYALNNLQNKGTLFIKPGSEIYEGQIIGIHKRSNDLTVNCLTGKKLTNMRASGMDELITLSPPKQYTLEQSLTFIDNDELIEVTPLSIRLRKRYLTENQRRQFYKEKNNLQ